MTANGTFEKQLADAERAVKYAARQKGRQLALPPDEHRYADSYSHACGKARAARAADPEAFMSEAHIRGWLVVAARRWVSDEGKRSRARERHEGRALRAESTPDLTALCELVRSLLPGLPRVLREPVELYLTNKTWKEVADALGVPFGTAYVRYTRALGVLQHELVRRGVTVDDLLRPH